VARVALITVSAAYGAGGSWLGPELAQRLGVPFFDRAVPVAVAERLQMPVENVVAAEDAVPTGFARVLARLGTGTGPFGLIPPEAIDDLVFEQEYPRRAAQEILKLAAPGHGVFLGRGAAVVLRDDARALHVRLDGPVERRIAQAMRLQGLDRDTAERRQQRTDRAREAYVRHFLDADPRDARLYHLIVDSTAIPLEACVDLIAAAAGPAPGTA
jgi:hypothetical protein